MRIRNVLMAFVAVTSLTSVAALTAPAYAGEVPTKGETTTTIELKDRSDISLGEIRQIVEKNTKEDPGAAGTVQVVTDTGKDLTDEQLKAVLAGKDADDVKVLATVERAAASTTLAELTKSTGTPAKVVYKASRGTIIVVAGGCTPTRCIIIIIVIRY
jgi:ABC-type glycerol-3-phosphate transport system substrate-binding protein